MNGDAEVVSEEEMLNAQNLRLSTRNFKQL
jgi:hypothetical protein